MASAAFTTDTFAFLADLEANNSKDWFDANRDRYETHWKARALDFITAMSGPLSRLGTPLHAVPRLNASLRRINRDVRFSADKSPYQPSLHMIFSSEGRFNKDAGMHLVLTPRGVGYGAGLYGFAPEVLSRYRDRVADPEGAAGLFAALDRARQTGSRLGEPDLARLPKGYEAEGRAAGLLRYKSIVCRTFDAGADPSVLTGPGAVDWALDITRAHLPLLAWLKTIQGRA